MEYLRGYRAFRQDPEWFSKIMIGALLFLSTAIIPIAGQIVLVGWQALIMRRAVRGQLSPLPRLDFDFQYLGRLLGVGFKGFIVRFLWSLPLVFVFGSLFFCLYFGVVFAAIGAQESGSDEMIPIFMLICVLVGFFVLIPLLALMSIPASVAAMRAELSDDLNQGMKLGPVLDFSRQHLGVLFKGSLILWIVGATLGTLGLLACYVGAFVAAVIGMVAHAHFMAQVYNLHVSQGGEGVPIGPDDLSEPPPPVAGPGLGPPATGFGPPATGFGPPPA